MYLEKLEIQGFKSFAEPVTLVFNRALTAVVGPNGSGKSNVADAIRWVLGEQSLKLLRGKKSDDVIFAGSDQKGRLGFARVAIFLNNQDHTAGIDFDEIMIERSIDRSGESEYRMNGAVTRLTDIQLLLARAQVGQKSYSVVGQGTIDSLLNLSPQDRRDFFDEATGVRQYQMKKHQALSKLDQTDENLNQAELVLTELEPRLRTLTRAVRRLERKEEIEKELMQIQGQYYGTMHHDLSSQLTSSRERRSTSESRLDALAAKQREIQKALDQYERRAGRDERFSALQAQLHHAQQEYNALTKKKTVLEGQRDVKAIQQGDASMVALRTRQDDLQRKKDKLTSTLLDLTKQLDREHATAKTLEQQYQSLSAHISTLKGQLSRDHEAIDWTQVERDVERLNAEHESIKEHLLAVDSADAITIFRERFKRFSDSLRNFLTLLKKKQASDQRDLWRQFEALSADATSLTEQLHAEQLRHTVTEQSLAVTQDQLREIDREEQRLEAQLAPDESSRTSAVEKEITDLDRDLVEHEQHIKTLRASIDEFNQQEQQQTVELVTLQKEFRTIQYDMTLATNELTTLKVDLAKLETRMEDLQTEITHEAPNITLIDTKHYDLNAARESITQMKKQLAIIGGIDAETVTEYNEVKEKYDYLKQQTTDLRSAQKSLVSLIDELDQHIAKQFQAAFKSINSHFGTYFKQLFSGGHAKLEITYSTPKTSGEEVEGETEAAEQPNDALLKRPEPLQYTVDIHASPPGKRLSSIAMLSGGEKALSSIALICAIIANNPPPFVVLDEVDAALDEANSIRFAEIVSELMDKSQFITITHNRATMHQAKILYGITMGADGISRLLSVNFEQADKLST